MHLFLHFSDRLQFPRVRFSKHTSVTGIMEATHMSIAESETKSDIAEKSIEFSLNQVILVDKSLHHLPWIRLWKVPLLKSDTLGFLAIQTSAQKFWAGPCSQARLRATSLTQGKKRVAGSTDFIAIKDIPLQVVSTMGSAGPSAATPRGTNWPLLPVSECLCLREALQVTPCIPDTAPKECALQHSVRKSSNGNLDKEPTLKKVKAYLYVPVVLTREERARRSCNGAQLFISIIVCFS